MKNRAAYMVGLNKMEIRETPVPEPKAGEVLVKIEYVGICGSDVHYFKDGRCGDFVVDGELMLGHEAGGVVEKLGEGVTDLKVGDKVALEPGITCGHCEFCKSGRYNLCPDVVFLATPPVQGCNEDYITFPADMCFKLPEGMSTKEGALIEPFAVGLHAAHQGKVGMGDQCIILGSGCIGLAIASQVPGARVVLGELDEGALRICRQNIRRNSLSGRVVPMQTDAREKPEKSLGEFQCIVSNPPYIPRADIDGLDVSVRDYEPHLALDGGEDGLDFYRSISEKWKDALVPGGRLYFEVGIGQADSVLRIMRAQGFGDIQVIKDLHDIPRVVFGTLCTEV